MLAIRNCYWCVTRLNPPVNKYNRLTDSIWKSGGVINSMWGLARPSSSPAHWPPFEPHPNHQLGAPYCHQSASCRGCTPKLWSGQPQTVGLQGLCETPGSLLQSHQKLWLLIIPMNAQISSARKNHWQTPEHWMWCRCLGEQNRAWKHWLHASSIPHSMRYSKPSELELSIPFDQSYCTFNGLLHHSAVQHLLRSTLSPRH